MTDWAEAIIREVMAEQGYSLTDEQVSSISNDLRSCNLADELYDAVFEVISSAQMEERWSTHK